MTTLEGPLRLFLDSGVIIEGSFSVWGASKAVLVLATVRSNYTVVLAEAIEREVQRNLARKVAILPSEAATTLAASVSGWFDRVRIERHPFPTSSELDEEAVRLLPVTRHVNDLPAVVTAVKARPDWILSTNTDHWNAALAVRIGLRVATPYDFLRQLSPRESR